MISIKLGLSKGAKSSFADFIRDAKSDQKTRLQRSSDRGYQAAESRDDESRGEKSLIASHTAF